MLYREVVVSGTDSAVPISEGTKILNTTNKVFMVVRKCPGEVLINNNASLMGVPREIIINEYRDYTIRENIDLSELEEYGSSFLDYIE